MIYLVLKVPAHPVPLHHDLRGHHDQVGRISLKRFPLFCIVRYCPFKCAKTKELAGVLVQVTSFFSLPFFGV